MRLEAGGAQVPVKHTAVEPVNKVKILLYIYKTAWSWALLKMLPVTKLDRKFPTISNPKV
jgi:hypothetical protein